MTTKLKRRFSQDFSGESKTQQHFKAAADVNNIVAHFRSTGIDPYAARLTTQKFGYASSQTFSDAMQNVAEINTAFEELPSSVRQSHSNDPAVWLDSLATPTPQDDPIVSPERSQEPSDSPEITDSKGEMDST